MLRAKVNLFNVKEILEIGIIWEKEIISTFPESVNASFTIRLEEPILAIIYLDDKSDTKKVCNWLKKYYGDFVECIYADNTIYQHHIGRKIFNNEEANYKIWICQGEGISCKIEYGPEKEIVTKERGVKLICK